MTTDTSPEGVRDEAPELRVADMLLCRPGPKLDALDYTAAATIQRLHARVQELERAVAAEREACAKVCDEALDAFTKLAESGDKRFELTMLNGASAARTLGERIRARGAQGESNASVG